MKNRLRNVSQGLIDLFRSNRRRRIELQLAEIEELIAAEQWELVSARAKAAGIDAQKANHFGLVSRIGRVLEQIGEFEAAAPIRYAGEKRHYRPRLPVWNGEEIPDRALIIDQVFDHLGQQIRHARLIHQAALRSGKCIVLTEPRLVPLLQRTFAGTSVVDRASKASAERNADLITNNWDLAGWFANSKEKIEAGFVPLTPDGDLVRSFRMQYAPRGAPTLIGISWGTLNPRRQVPALDDWRALLSGVDAQFVSLQYGEVQPAIDRLADIGNVRILNDRTVDQLQNMDRFAAQIAALDLVVTVDNTIAHTAAALGKRTIVLTDDGASHWPLRGDRTPWYPSATVVRRRRRIWGDVLTEARWRLDAEFPSRIIQ